MVKIKDSKWARASGLRKRVSGFFGYLTVAIVTLFDPVAADMATFKVLSEQFEDDGQ